MTITTLDGYIGAVKQRIELVKTASRTSVAGIAFSVFDLAGQPGAGTLAGTSTTAPVMPTDTTAGCPLINFTSGTTYLSKIEFNNTVTSRLAIFDLLSKSGAYSYTAGTTTITTPLDVSSRCPDVNGSSWGGGNEIWIEVSTAFSTGTAWQVQITYTSSAGTTGRSSIISASMAAAALTLGKMLQIALASGDTGVEKIESVIVTNGGTAMTAGAFNVLILRPLWTSGRVPIANGGDIHDMLKTGLPIVYNTSALYLQVFADSTATGLPECNIELANG
jgi:hypothetical protein